MHSRALDATIGNLGQNCDEASGRHSSLAHTCGKTAKFDALALGFPGLPRDLNSPNRRMRTRLSGGVAGVAGETRRPYADTSRSGVSVAGRRTYGFTSAP